MLYLYFGSVRPESYDKDKYVRNIDGIFDAYYKESWLDDSWAKCVIEGIDKSKLISPQTVDSPWLGLIGIPRISGGAKQLIMMKNQPNLVYDGNNLGDNCFTLLLELSKNTDLMMDLWYFPKEFEWPEGVEVTILNNNVKVGNFYDFTGEHFKYTEPFFDFDSVAWPLEIDTSLFHEDDGWFSGEQED